MNDSLIRNAGLSRRQILKTLSGGLGLGAGITMLPSVAVGAKRAPRPPLKQPPTLLAQQDGALRWSSGMVGAALPPFNGGVHFNGMVVFTDTNNGAGTMFGNDINATGALNHGEVDLGSGIRFIGKPVVLPALNTAVALTSGGDYGVVYRDATGSLHAGLNKTALPIASNIVEVSGNIIVQVTNDNRIFGFQFNSPTALVEAFVTNPLGPGVQNAVLQTISANTYIYVVPDPGGYSNAYYANTNGLITTQKTPLATGPFCFGDPYFYCLSNDGSNWSIRQYSLADSSFAGWPSSAFVSVNTNLGNLVLAGNYIFVGAGDGKIYAVNINDGTLGAPILVANGMYDLSSCEMFIENGAAFFCFQNGKVYGVDLPSGGAKTVFYDTKVDPTFMVDVENGVCVVANNTNGLLGVDVASELRQYSCYSVLMADNYIDNGKGGNNPNLPAYRTVIQLVDGNNNPRGNIQVQIQTTDTVTITSGSITQTLEDPGDTMWLQTDPSGHLDFVSAADSIQSPALYIWAAFMNKNEYIVVYPDHEALNRLANYGASDYANGTAFDGSSVLVKGVDAAQVAQTVQTAMGGGVSSSGSGSNPYSAYPGSNTNMAYQSSQGDTSRPFNQTAAKSFTTDITLNGDGSATVSYNCTNTSSCPANVGTSLGLSFDDFVNDVVKAGKKIKQIVVTAGQDIAHAITDIDNLIYNFTIKAFEDVAHVMTAFFHTICNDISRAVQFLSKLFKWEQIKQNHDYVVGAIKSAQQSFRTFLTNDVNSLNATLHGIFQDAENWVENQFDALINAIGGQNANSNQQNGNDPKQIFGSNGNYAQSRWLHSKVKENASSAKTPLITTTLPFSLTDASNQISNLLKTQIPNAIKPVWDDLKSEYADFVKDFNVLFTNPMAFATQSFQGILATFRDIAKAVLTAIDLAFELVLSLLADLLDTLLSALLGTFQIPFLSDLYHLITGSNLTLLDLAAWVVAVPLTLIQNLSASPGKLQSTSQQATAWSVATIFGSLIDALNDLVNLDPSSALSWIDLGFATVTYFLSTNYDFSSTISGVYWGFGSLPLLFALQNCVNATFVNPLIGRNADTQADVDSNNTECYYLNGFAGLIGMIIGGAGAKVDPKNFDGTSHFSLIQNLVGNAGLLAKGLYPAVPPVTILTDVVCPVTSMWMGRLGGAV
jgi:hypothetical protein